MIGPVIKGYFEIDGGESGQHSFCAGFDDSFFDGGNILSGNNAADDRIHKFKTPASRQRLNLYPTVTELTVAARLFFMSTLHAGLAFNGFAVRNFRRT